MVQERRVVYEHLDVPEINTFKVYRERANGYRGVEKALREMEPESIVKLVSDSGLRGRGGAGFSTGMKWSFVPKDIFPKYLCCNADESEPGTCKDRYLIERKPHMLIEGIIIACYTLGINTAYIYIRGEFMRGKRVLDAAIDEAYQAGYLGKDILGTGFDLDVYTHPGAGAYICGEETGLIESLEGRRGQPRNKPPFPAVEGLFHKPTVVQNVETLANVPALVLNGPERFASMGVDYNEPGAERPNPTLVNTGTKLYCVSGHVEKPGVYELELGLMLRELIEVAGGVRGGNRLKAVIPGGSSAPVLTHYEIDVPMDFTSLGNAKTMLGSGAVIVMDETVCMVDALLNILKFYGHESCGQCTPCRWGTPWVRDIVDRIEHGEGRPGDIEKMQMVANNIANIDTMTWDTICVFGISVSWPAVSYSRKFRPEFDAHLREGKCVVLDRDEACVPPEENYAVAKPSA